MHHPEASGAAAAETAATHIAMTALESGIATIFAELHAEAEGAAGAHAMAAATDTEDEASETPELAEDEAGHDAVATGDEAGADAGEADDADAMTQQLLGELDRLWQRHAA